MTRRTADRTSAGAIAGACAAALWAALYATGPSAQGLFGRASSLAPVVEAVAPAVVNIVVLTSKPGGAAARPLEADPDFGELFSRREGSRLRPVGTGSGVIINAARGHVMTNEHVVGDPGIEKIVVILRDRRELEATLVGKDPGTDIAVLQIRAEDLTEVTVADSARIRIGDYVLAIGNPLGLGQSVTSGIVSALGRTIGMNSYEEFIQFDAPIHPGNSGGGLFDLEGRLIGINSAGINIQGPGGSRIGGTGVSWAVPSSIAMDVAAQLIGTGEVRRGRAGISAVDVTPSLAKKNQLAVREGAFVNAVEPQSGAGRAGLKAGDVITELRGKPVRSWSELRNRLGLVPVGEFAEVGFLRDGSAHRERLQIDPIVVPRSTGGKRVAQLSGVTVAERDGAIIVADVDADSPSYRAGVRPGDVIEGVNGMRSSSAEELSRILQDQQGDKRLSIARGEGKLTLRLPASY